MQTLYKWLFLILVLLGFCACEEVDEADRFTGPVEFVPKKNVLIEDFTGQRCLNCPLAANAVHAMQATYGAEHVIAVASTAVRSPCPPVRARVWPSPKAKLTTRFGA